MSDPFIAEVKLFSFDFAPRGWATCDGQVLPIAQHQALFAVLGTTYGGNGSQTFALPDLRGRTPIHVGTSQGGSNHPLGQAAGKENDALTLAQLPAHGHGGQGTSATPGDTTQTNTLLCAVEGGRRPITPYGPASGLTPLHPDSVANAGANQGHNTMQPFLTVNFCIALAGIFPVRD